VHRRRPELAALVTLLVLAGGCGGTEEAAAPPATVTVTVTTTASSWTEGDCRAAGRHADSIYRVCYSSRADRGIQVLRGGRVEDVAVEDPPGASGGHWRWAALSPNGETFLATWSGECEIPTAFTFAARGGEPVPVTGETDWTRAPESEALGWTTGGEPIVRLLRGICGTGADDPGIYLFADSGPRRVDGELEESLEPRDVG
jgi:hypothetical protein